MNILYIANVRIPTEKAHGIQIMKMCEAFASQAHIELVVPNRHSSIKDDPHHYYNVKKNFLITRLFTIDIVSLGPIGFALQSFSFAVASFFYLRAQPKDSIVYTRDGLIAVVSRLLVRRVIFEAHTIPQSFFSKLLITRAHKIVSISSGLKSALSTFYRGEIMVAPDGVDLDEFLISVTKTEAKKGLALDSDLPTVMYVGKLDSWKGYRTLLEASLALKDTAQIVIIGGDEEPVAKLKALYPHVIFKGYLPYRELPRHQHAADILVIPNSAESDLSRMYTSPLKIFAHMTSGVPIVASDLPSIREVLNRENALLVPPDNPTDLATSITTLLTEKDRAVALSKRALQDVLQYSWIKRAKRIISFID